MACLGVASNDVDATATISEVFNICSSFPECMREEYAACFEIVHLLGPLFDQGVLREDQ